MTSSRVLSNPQVASGSECTPSKTWQLIIFSRVESSLVNSEQLHTPMLKEKWCPLEDQFSTLHRSLPFMYDLGVFRRVNRHLAQSKLRKKKKKKSHCFLFVWGRNGAGPSLWNSLKYLRWISFALSSSLGELRTNRVSCLFVRADAWQVYICQREHHWVLCLYTHSCFLTWLNSSAWFAEIYIK